MFYDGLIFCRVFHPATIGVGESILIEREISCSKYQKNCTITLTYLLFKLKVKTFF